MDLPNNTSLKTINQNIAEKGIVDKMEAVQKEFSDLDQQMKRIVQALEAGTISIEEAKTAIERFDEKMADLQAEQDGLQKKLEEVNGQILTIETASVEMMETEDETKALFDNAMSIFKRLTEIDGKNHSEHLALSQKIVNSKKYLENHPDKHKQFFYFYLLPGLVIAATIVLAIVITLVHR